ncbi:MAG: arylsulfatase, partial [Verrucomicrobiota bacterium]
TVAKLARAELPTDRPSDGTDASPVLFDGRGIERDVFCYYRGETLFAARLGDWKAHFITQGSYGDPKPVKHDRPLLYHLAVDPSEAHEVGEQHPDVLARITAAVEAHRARTPLAPSQLIEIVPPAK